MTIFLIRHGETTGDVEDRYGGWYDDHLTARGQEQVSMTASQLVGKGIEIIFSSPLIRAREASNIIADAIDAPIEVVDGLKERNYGILTGFTKDEAQQTYPDVVRLHDNPLNTDPEGERYDDFCSRVAGVFESLTQQEYATIAIVTHGGPIKCMLKMLGKPVPDRLGDGGIIEVKL